MNCDPIREMIPTYLDGELDALTSQAVEKHLEQCPECQDKVRLNRAMSDSIRSDYPYERAPASVRRTVVSATVGRQTRRSWGRSYSFAAGLAAGILLMFILFRPAPRPSLLQDQLIAGHIRSLISSHLVDVASSNRHTVKPWFQGKLDFSPDVVDLASKGFPLVGGRIEFLGGQPAAGLVYRRNRHVLNVFVTASPVKPIQDFDFQGFHTRRFSLNGLDYWVVSDLNTAEISTFVQEFKAAAG